MLRIEVSADLDSLLAERASWDALAGGVPFRETSWLGPWWQHFGAGRQPYVVLARDDQDCLRGLLPLYRLDATPRGSLSVIGQGLACSDYVSILARPGDAAEVAAAMGQFLASTAADGQLGWDRIEIDGVIEGDQPMAALAAALQQGGASLHAHSRMSTWFKAKDPSWEDHLKHFGKTQRRKFRRWSEKIETTEGLERTVTDSTDALDQDLANLIRLHQRRWNEVGQPGSFADCRFREFIAQAANAFLNEGRLYLPTLTLEGDAVAAELHLVGHDGRLYCYSSGYDIDQPELEPGRILNVETLRDLYRRDFAGIDFLRGDEPYKQRMAATARRVFHLRIGAPTWLPRLRHAAWCTGFELKQWVRRRTGRRPAEVADLTIPA